MDSVGRCSSLVALDNLSRAAGAVRSDEEDRHFGLYREHCVACHGISGDGLGPASRLLAPYPRDFRLGKFKYKSTPIGTKPTRGDLRRTLTEGLPGTSMPSFRLLKSDELDALVDYVIYLSVRGETERQLLVHAASELDLDGGERVFDPSWIESSAQSAEQPAAGWQRVQKMALNVAAQWETAQSKTILAPQPPKDYPIFDAGEKLSGAKLAELEASIQRGRQIFAGPIANCVSCHGPTGLGDGQKNNYDAWTKRLDRGPRSTEP